MIAAGTWQISMNTPMGVQGGTITINEDGSGMVTDAMGQPCVLQELKIDGNKFTAKAEVNSPMGKMPTTLDAAVAGDTISGTMQTPMGPLQFSGNRT